MRKQSIASISAAIALALAAGSAQAATTTANLNVSASVASNCLASATPIAFGAYDGTAQLTGNSTISVRCTKGEGFTVTLNGGSTASGTIAQRLLQGGGAPADKLEYNLYQDGAFGTLWGDGTTGSDDTGTGAGMGLVNAQTFAVFGRLPNSASNQTQPVGSYSDIVTVSVEY
jgi:spore coat protein U-like protein